MTNMKTLSGRITARDMRIDLARVLDRVAGDFERLGVTRNGKLTAVLISVEDLKLLEEFEAARDATE